MPATELRKRENYGKEDVTREVRKSDGRLLPGGHHEMTELSSPLALFWVLRLLL